MFLVDIALLVGIVADPIRCQFEKTVVRIKHCSRKLYEEISCKSTSISTSLALEIYIHLSFHFSGTFVSKRSIWLHKNLLPPNWNSETGSSLVFFQFVNFFPKELFFVLKVEHVGHNFNQLTKWKCLDTFIVIKCDDLINYVFVYETKLAELI